MSLLRRAAGGAERRVLTSFGPYGYGDGIPPYANGDGRIPNNGWWPPTWSGANVNDTSSLQLSTFYACVRLLADSIAALPWDSYRQRGPAKVLVSPQPSLLSDPHPDLTIFDWKHVMMVSLAIRGNFFGLVTQRDAYEFPTQILPLHPDWVVWYRDPTTGERTVYINGQQIDFHDVFHVRAFTLPGYDLGLNPIQVHRQSIGLGLATEEFGAKWFRDGAAPSSTLTTEQTLTNDQIKQTQQQWISTQGGRRLPAVLSGGFSWKPVTISPEESQFLETRKFQVSEIARMFGIPPHMVGDVDRSTSWGTGIEQMSVGFVTYTLAPWLARIEAALNRCLPRGQFAKFSVEGLLRGDIESRYAAYTAAIEGSWMNPDEVRAKEDLPPIPEGKGKTYLQPLNFGPLGYEPPQDPPDPVAAPARPKRPRPKPKPAAAAATPAA